MSLSCASVSDLTGLAGLTMNLMLMVPTGATSKPATLIELGAALFKIPSVILIGAATMATSALPAYRSLRPLPSPFTVTVSVRPVSVSIAALLGVMMPPATAAAPLTFNSAAASVQMLADSRSTAHAVSPLRVFKDMAIDPDKRVVGFRNAAAGAEGPYAHHLISFLIL